MLASCIIVTTTGLLALRSACAAQSCLRQTARSRWHSSARPDPVSTLPWLSCAGCCGTAIVGSRCELTLLLCAGTCLATIKHVLGQAEHTCASGRVSKPSSTVEPWLGAYLSGHSTRKQNCSASMTHQLLALWALCVQGVCNLSAACCYLQLAVRLRRWVCAGWWLAGTATCLAELRLPLACTRQGTREVTSCTDLTAKHACCSHCGCCCQRW
jgi:hypothetical protein